MTPLTLLIVDDEALARSRLRELLSDIAPSCPTEMLFEAENGQMALDWLHAENQKDAGRLPDVMLADIHMPRMSGLELAGRLCFLSQPVAIIFTTAYDNHAVQAFDLNVVDYLLKPVRAQRLLAALMKVRPRPVGIAETSTPKEGGRSHLLCHESGRMLLIPIEEVLYFRADLKYVIAHTRDREYVLDDTLTMLEKEFPYTFVRLHRAILIARTAIAGFERAQEDDDAYGYALLRDMPEKLPVSRRQWTLARGSIAQEDG
jgi:two-component system response regulator AlgR